MLVGRTKLAGWHRLNTVDGMTQQGRLEVGDLILERCALFKCSVQHVKTSATFAHKVDLAETCCLDEAP